MCIKSVEVTPHEHHVVGCMKSGKNGGDIYISHTITWRNDLRNLSNLITSHINTYKLFRRIIIHPDICYASFYYVFAPGKWPCWNLANISLWQELSTGYDQIWLIKCLNLLIMYNFHSARPLGQAESWYGCLCLFVRLCVCLSPLTIFKIYT